MQTGRHFAGKKRVTGCLDLGCCASPTCSLPFHCCPAAGRLPSASDRLALFSWAAVLRPSYEYATAVTWTVPWTPAKCAVYPRRRPERTPLYRAVQGHLETYLVLAGAGHTDGEGVPGYLSRWKATNTIPLHISFGAMDFEEKAVTGGMRRSCPVYGCDYVKQAP